MLRKDFGLLFLDREAVIFLLYLNKNAILN